MNRYTIALAIIFITMLLFSTDLLAQIVPPPNPGNGANVPLDPMSWTLLGAGASYAAYKYRKNKRKN